MYVCQEVRMRRSAVLQSDIDPDVQQINALNQLQRSAKSAQSFTYSLHARCLLFVFKSAARLRKKLTRRRTQSQKEQKESIIHLWVAQPQRSDKETGP